MKYLYVFEYSDGMHVTEPMDEPIEHESNFGACAVNLFKASDIANKKTGYSASLRSIKVIRVRDEEA